jgi:hypothetical protein
MQYKITYLMNSDYCELKPSDKECQRTITIEANSKVEAVTKLHEQWGMVFSSEQFNCGTACKVQPVIWSIEETPI